MNADHRRSDLEQFLFSFKIPQHRWKPRKPSLDNFFPLIFVVKLENVNVGLKYGAST